MKTASPDTLTIAPRCIEDGVAEYELHCGAELHARLSLIAGTFVSLTWTHADGGTELPLAIGRFIAQHSSLRSASALRAEFLGLWDAGSGRPRAAWPDLPQVLTTPVEIRGRLGCCGVTCVTDTAVLFLTRDTPIPMVTALVSRHEPGRALLLAIGRMALDYAATFSAAAGQSTSA